MNLRNLLSVAAIIYLIFGVAAAIVPDQLVALYGATPDPITSFAVRVASGAILGFAIISWMARDDAGSVSKRGIVLANLVNCVVGFIVYLLGTTQGMLNSMGWVSVALYLLLGLGFAYFTLMSPAPVTRTT